MRFTDSLRSGKFTNIIILIRFLKNAEKYAKNSHTAVISVILQEHSAFFLSIAVLQTNDNKIEAHSLSLDNTFFKDITF